MKNIPVSLTEEMILNYSALPKELNGFRRYRIEYNGHAESCVREETIYLPPTANAFILDLLFDFWQAKGKKKADLLAEIVVELRRNLEHRPILLTDGQNEAITNLNEVGYEKEKSRQVLL